MNYYLLLLAALLLSCEPVSAQRSTPKSAKASTVAKARKKPRNLEESFARLDELLPDSVRRKILAGTENDFVARSHFGLGMWMRNKWGLWRGSELAKHFNSIGIYHPDDMSEIILTTYYRRLAGLDPKVDEQIKSYQRYWKVSARPTKNMFPKDVENLQFNTSFGYGSGVFGAGIVHVGTSEKSDDVWLYDYDRGWKKVTKEDIERIGKSRPASDTTGAEPRQTVLDEIFSRQL